MGILIIPFALIMLVIVIWVSYYTSRSVYRSLVKNDKKNPRVFQVLTFVLMFAALSALLLYFVANSLTFER
jgi:hypothetical protein